MLFSTLQEYVDELKQLLSNAKHPKTINILQKAITEALPSTEQQNGQPETVRSTESADLGLTEETIMKPIMKQKDSSISMAKISNYGMYGSEMCNT